MVTSLQTQAAESFSSHNRSTLDRLVRILSFANDGLTLLYARCNVSVLRSQLIAAASTQLAAEDIHVLTIHFEPEEAIHLLRQQLREEVKVAQLSETNRRLVLFITGLEYSIPYDRPDAPMLTELNVGRELFRHDTPYPLVFWLPDYALTSIIRHAPDFWSWRSGLFEFEVPPVVRTQELERIVIQDSAWMTISNLTVVEKERRRTHLENLLDEYNPLSQDERIQNERKDIYFSLAQIYHVLNNWSQAIHYYEDSLDICRQLHDRGGEGRTLRYLGLIYQDTGELEKAIECYDQSIEAFEKVNDEYQVAVTLGQIADILQQRGETDEALRILREELLPAFKRLNDVRSRTMTMGKIADILQQRGETDEALRIRREEQLPVYERTQRRA